MKLTEKYPKLSNSLSKIHNKDVVSWLLGLINKK